MNSVLYTPSMIKNATLYLFASSTGIFRSFVTGAVKGFSWQDQSTKRATAKKGTNRISTIFGKRYNSEWNPKELLMYFCIMKHLLLILVLCCLVLACRQEKRYHGKDEVPVAGVSQGVQDILAYQKAQNEEFKDPETSPLPDRYRKNFTGLDFFPADENYVVKAYLERTPDAEPFMMPSTTDEKSWEVVYGIAKFELNGELFQLEIYQGLDLMQREGFEDYLFLPFLDMTNGEETYGGGRYLDLRIPEGDTLQIDFNRAYNPYCV